MNQPATIPDMPVIVVHLRDKGLTACSGDPTPNVNSDCYPNVPRYLCPLCAHFAFDKEP